MKDLFDTVAAVVDHGLFLIPVARRLAESCKRVYVVNPSWQTGFSTVNQGILGEGYESENIIRVDEIWDVKNELDLAVYPDIQHGGEQLELESQGIAVWGARRGDQQELDRELFLRTLRKVGLEVPPHVVCEGIDELEKVLRRKEDCYVKISKYRGSLETTHWRCWELDAELFYHWRVKFWRAGRHMPFIVCDKIDAPVEIGGDTFTVLGQWPGLMLHGIEGKDKCYMAAVTPRQEMPQILQDIMDAFSPVFAKTRSRMQWSMEVRDNKFIDPTCRGGLPSTSSQLVNCRNWPQVIWAGANGELVEPEYEKQYTAEAIVTLKGPKEIAGEMIVPDELDPWFKPSYCCKLDGVTCFPPDDSHGDAIGWVVATGDTPQEAVQELNSHADMLPDGCNADTESLAFVLKDIHEEEAVGIDFGTHEVPEPASVLED